MKVAVTGASGFVGRALCPALDVAGHERVPLEAAAAVVHLAGIAHRKVGAEELQRVNVTLAVEVARQAAAIGASFLFMSSLKVHGEESRTPLRADSPLAPQDEYARSKAQAEDALRAIPGLRLAVLRPPLAYGPGVKANFLALMRAIARGWPLPLGSIRNRRSLVYVGNLAAAVLECLGKEGTFLVSDGTAVSTPQLCADLGAALGRPARLFAFPPRLLPGKLARSLEIDAAAMPFTPLLSREEGLRATARWYLGL